MIEWVHARQAQWAEAERLDLDPVPLPVSASAGTYAPYEPHEPSDASDSSERDMFGPSEPAGGGWLPRVAIGAALIGAAGAGVWLWPNTRGGTTNAVTQASAPLEAAPAGSAPAAAVKPSTAVPPGTRPTTVKPGAASVESAAGGSGFVAVFAPFDISVSSANEVVALDERGRAMLPSGKYRLRLRNPAVGYDEIRTVEVRPTETTTINLVPQTPLNVTANEAAQVFVDGERTGGTPFNGRIPYGAHTITIRTAGDERQFQIEATMKPVQLEVDFSKP
jgi:hypothetical protein